MCVCVVGVWCREEGVSEWWCGVFDLSWEGLGRGGLAIGLPLLLLSLVVCKEYYALSVHV